jgi:hypothetical protein
VATIAIMTMAVVVCKRRLHTKNEFTCSNSVNTDDDETQIDPLEQQESKGDLVSPVSPTSNNTAVDEREPEANTASLTVVPDLSPTGQHLSQADSSPVYEMECKQQPFLTGWYLRHSN